MTETHHRVKNNLQLITAMMDFQTLGAGDSIPISRYKHLSNQVRALAAVHEILTADTKAGGDATTVSLPALLEKLLFLLQSIVGISHIEHRLDEVTVSADKGNSIALIVNELVANAAAYGNGSITIRLTIADHKAVLSVLDNGPGFPEGFHASNHAHTGLELVESLTKLDLGGEVRYCNRAEGGGCVDILFHIDAQYGQLTQGDRRSTEKQAIFQKNSGLLRCS